MFISKTALPRRTFLRGMGVTLALPLLESMVPALTARTVANPQRRFGAIFVPMGERPGYWTPKTLGSDIELTPILEPLEPFKDQLTIVSQLCDPLDGHATTVASWLSGSIPFRTIAENVRNGVTVDQVIAKQIGQETVFPSLELATEDFTGYVGGCETQYACAYMNTLSWANATTPLPMEINPRVTFERMFGRAGTSAQRLADMRLDRSILDLLKHDVKDLQSAIGPKDRARLSDYLDNVREIEHRIQKAQKQATTELTVPDAPIGVPESFEEHVALQFDLLVLAFEADLTKVFTFMMSRDASQRVYPNLNISEPHHSMSHHGNNPEKMADLVKLNTYHVALFAKFLEKLRSTPDGDGSLLDHSIILYGSGMSESNTHSRLDVPTAILGGGAGVLKGNRHIKVAKETPLANLMLDFANKFDCELDTFGISTGRVEIPIVKAFLGIAVVLAGVTLQAAGTGPGLIHAVKEGNLAVVRGLIARHANVNAAEPDGMTALHWAIRGSEVEMAQLLVHSGADVNAANRYGVTPLWLAAQTGEPALVDLLLQAGADANAASPEGETPLMTAARTGNPEVLRSLAAYGADVNAREDWQGQTALMWAATKNHAAAIATLVELGADKNARSKILQFPEFKFETSGNPVTALPRGGWTPLMYAARDGAIAAVRALADAGADLSATDPDGTTALVLAITNAHFDTAAALLDKGADPNIPDGTGMAALYAAVDMHTLPPAFGRPAPKLRDSIDAAGLVKVLLTHGAGPNARLKRPILGRHHLPTGDAALGEGTTPLARASKSNDLAVMTMLLDAGADPTLTLRDRTTPLMIVAAGGAVVDVDAGAMPLTEESALAAMELLVAHGVDVDAFNAAGQTALHLAAARGADILVRYLAEADATLDMHNKQGRTPLDLAISGFDAPAPVNDVDGAPERPKASTIALLRGLMANAGLSVPADSH